MSQSIIRKTMTQGVGRRIFGLFLFAAIIPMIVTAGLAYFEFHRGLENEASKALKNSAKDYGVQILTRLEQASEKSAEVARNVNASGIKSISNDLYLLTDFESIWIVGDQLPPSISASSGDFEQLQETGLRDDEVRLLLMPDKQMILVRSVANDNIEHRLIAFQLKFDEVWGLRENLPFSIEFCVFAERGDRLFCTAEIDQTIHASLVNKSSDNRGSIFSKWTHQNEAQYVALWQLFLRGKYGADAFDIVAIQPQSIAMESSTDFRRIFLPALILIVVLVSMLSMSVIDHSLGPLRKVTLAAQQLASGKLNSRVQVTTGDEFEHLGDAFNHMADRIGNQISALEAMSGIDRLILTGTKLEEVSQDVVAHMIGLTKCESAAVIARDSDAPDVGTMISSHSGVVHQERIELPDETWSQWHQPRQIRLADVKQDYDPFAERFRSFGQTHVVLLPVMLKDKLKGLLLLGFDGEFDMSQTRLQRCVDLAGRFAVALSSVEREEALYHQAHFDTLTGLPNRQLLKDRLNQNLANARLDQHYGAILFLDLDRFKEVNDVFGHSVGDAVLKQTSERIKSVVRDRDTVARLGGDEFVVVLANVRNDSIVRGTAKRLLERLSEAFTVAGTDHYLSASIGITMFPEDGATVESLLKNSDAAMYRAKDAGRGRFEFFSKRLNAESRRKIGLERDLRIATQQGDLELYYQPQIEISTGGISGAEALLRWTHRQHGQISPDEFIPLAEDSELIVEIGSWVIERACSDLAVLLDKGFHPGPMSVNVSGRQLADTKFTRAVMEPIRRHGIHPGFIQLEVTETVVAQNRDRAITILENLRSEGVRVAIDDFGTGYSSLSYLQQMPYDVIKIDKSFIDGIGSSEGSDNICRTIIKMAEQLGKKSIAEGVEKQAQVDFLRENGCDFIQGFFYAMPLTSTEFLDFVQKQDFHTQRRKALEIF